MRGVVTEVLTQIRGGCLTRRPGHLATGEKMDVKMGHGFARVRTVVDHEAKAGGEIEFLRELRGNLEQVTEDWFVSSGGDGEARDGLLRNNQEVNRRLRLNVVQRDAEIVFVLELRRDFAVDDFLEEGLHGGGRKVVSSG